MAKSFVKISLASKLRLVFGAAVLAIIAAALIVPWYFMELLAEQGLQPAAAELTRLRLNEWIRDHPGNPDASSEVANLYTLGARSEGRKGPLFIKLDPNLKKMDALLTPPARQALRMFVQNPDQDSPAIIRTEEDNQTVYRCFLPVRVDAACARCHNQAQDPKFQYSSGQLVGVIDVALPGSLASGPLIWWTRGTFVIGGILAGLLAIISFAIITQRLILRPVRKLRDMADKVAEGDLAVRSSIRTQDELQRLGESFNEMLEAIGAQHEKLRSANRALDLKLNELAEANVALFQANQVKTEFLANVSHELRTPLNSILGFSDLVAGASDERVRRYGQNIAASARSLLAMINDLLDLAKIEAGRAEVRFDKVSVADTCQTLLALMQPLADKKQLTLEGEIAPDLPIIVTDAGKLQQILYNLLSNAVKFTPSGGKVTLSASPAGTGGNGGGAREVAVSVADTGPGIPEADQQRIFEKFYQGERSLTKETGGTGLGLAISRELAVLIGGRLSLRSSPGHGAVFTLTLPIEPDSNGETARTREAPPEKPS